MSDEIKRKRGRPKKVVEPDTLESIAQDAKNWAKPSNKKKLATLPAESTAFVNRTYHFKDGTICRVYYGGCKAKPIDITFTT